MAEFVSKDLGQGTSSSVEYDKYCHFVAGLVGDGLTRLFAATGIEGQELLLAPELANRCAFDCGYFGRAHTNFQRLQLSVTSSQARVHRASAPMTKQCLKPTCLYF